MKFVVLSFLLLTAPVIRAQSSPSNPVISIDFSTPVKVSSVSGILHGASDVAPGDSVITPLQPKLWRLGSYAWFTIDNGQSWPTMYNRFSGMGAKVQLVVSDIWQDGSYSSTMLWPYQNWQAWEDFIRQTARDNKGRDIQWDIWNEPNTGAWLGTRDQFFETYLRAYVVLRQELGSTAMIGGPSISSYSSEWLTAFAQYCLQNGCEINFLSWHELYDSNGNITSVASHLSEARSTLQSNPVFAAVKIGQLQVNEIVGWTAPHNPGVITGDLFYLEKGKADAAAKACWSDSQHVSECENNTLDGLLTPDGLPRAAWWVYKIYADGVATRVVSSSSDTRLVALASGGNSTSMAQVLVGYFNSDTGATAAANVRLHLANLRALAQMKGHTTAHVTVDRIPNTNEDALAAPVPIAQMDVAANTLWVPVVIPSIGVGEAIRVTIAPQ